MTGISFKVDYKDVDAISKAMAGLTTRFNHIAAISMSKSSKDAANKLRTIIFPQIKGGPVPWTSRGLRSYPATPTSLVTAVGWNYGDANLWKDWSGSTRMAGGVPSGRYMGLLSKGGDRRPKASEIQLRRSGLIKQDQFIIPNRFAGSAINQYGNLPGSEYKRILSRLRASNIAGSIQNAPKGKGSRNRSAAKRASSDYFILRSNGAGPSRWQLGAYPSAIALRVGSGPIGGTGRGSGKRGRPQTVGYKRGFARALNITDQPNYEKRFDVQSIAMSEFQRVFPQYFKKITNETVAYRKSQGLM